MTDERLNQLDALASKAIDAPWSLADTGDDPSHDWTVLDAHGMWVAKFDVDKASAEYVAAMHPGMCCEMIAEIRRLRDTARGLEAAIDHRAGEIAKAHAERDEAHRLVRDEFTELRKVVETRTAERIAEHLAKIAALLASEGNSFAGAIAAAAESVRTGAWRKT